jgi:hypothetical protein
MCINCFQRHFQSFLAINHGLDGHLGLSVFFDLECSDICSQAFPCFVYLFQHRTTLLLRLVKGISIHNKAISELPSLVESIRMCAVYQRNLKM